MKSLYRIWCFNNYQMKNLNVKRKYGSEHAAYAYAFYLGEKKNEGWRTEIWVGEA